MNTAAEITRLRMALSDLKAFSPEWTAINNKLMSLMHAAATSRR